MWVDERKKALIRNVCIFILLVVVSAGLLVAVLSVKAKIAEEDALLSAEHANQRQELNEVRKENLESVQQTYEQDMAAVAQYLPGIVCWGDSLTAGSSGNVSYPATLQKYLDTYLSSAYDLRVSIENVELYSRVNWDDYKLSIPVVNMGGGKENTATILGRSGVVPFVVSADFVIPADATAVQIKITSPDGKAVTPLISGGAGVNPVTIAGIQGTMTVSTPQGGGQSYYEFTRLEPGSETPVSKGEEVLTDCQNAYQNYLHIVWLGTYGEYTNSAQLVKDVKTLLARQAGSADRYLVIGPCTLQGNWNINVANLDAVDSAMQQAFGNRYINVRKYLMEDGLMDAKLTASKNDMQIIKQGRVPESFRSNASGADLNAIAYKLIGKLVYDRMDLLGYFDEIRQELNLVKSTQEILKNNPQYFENLLNEIK